LARTLDGVGKVTALFGENSAGKSSLMQFLLMLKQTKNAADRGLVLDFGGGPTELVNLGNYRAAVHRARTTEALPDMGWDLTWRLPAELKIGDPLGSPSEVLYAGDQLQLTTSVGPAGSGAGISARRLTYAFEGATFGLRPKDSGGKFELASEGHSPFRFVRNVG
jgi:hypothetical protein